ncbi:hypothetical protein [Halobacteriovorax sp. JY17]|uniref:hypothetical protein n=1 Tax=Halobacteriovorax sp. JY17 TaxID=2014617 RepID=UPI000C425F83|nr:hypothetical protein [Halobacteriovorax sp. JY17]PIK16366.1 MAG: hypothetical protein CES88_06385 [Halobacteriovorax sp. JY17]
MEAIGLQSSQLNIGVALAHIAKIGRAFLVGQGILYPVQKGILKVGPLKPTSKKIRVTGLKKKLKKS